MCVRVCVHVCVCVCMCVRTCVCVSCLFLTSQVGQLLRKATAGTGVQLSLELGGMSPFIVYDLADLDSAVEGVVDAIWFSQGQVSRYPALHVYCM